MKTKLMMILATALIGIGSGFANPNAAEKNENNEIRKNISRVVSFPQKLKTPGFNETVNVRFKINADGKVVVLHISTKNEELKKHVMERIAKMNIQISNTIVDKVYNIELDFKVL